MPTRDETGKPDRSVVEILSIARRMLWRLAKVGAFGDRRPGGVRWMRAGGSRRIYEVELVDGRGTPGGFLLVSPSKELPPVLTVSDLGMGPITGLTPYCTQGGDRIEWLSPTCSAVVSRRGVIKHIQGAMPPLPRRRPRAKAKGASRPIDFFRKQREDLIVRMKGQFENARSAVFGALNPDDLAIPNEPGGDYYETLVEGSSWQPMFHQTPANSGANTNGYSIGCGPTAWATLIAWHDRTWTPDLLRGSQRKNDRDWGDEEEDSTYIDRLLVALHDALGTYGGGWWEETFLGLSGTGLNSDSDMPEGFVFLNEELDHDFMGPVLSGDQNLQSLYDYLSNENRPAIIWIPNHVCVAAGFLYDLSDEEAHFIKINTGWGDIQYIPAMFYEGKAWAFRDAVPATKETYSISSHRAPWVLASKTDTRIYIREDDGQIVYLESASAGSNPSPSSRVATGLFSEVAPRLIDDGYSRIALTVNGGRVYLWSEQAAGGWQSLPFPDVEASTAPAMCRSGDHLVVVLHNADWGVQVFGSSSYRAYWIGPGAPSDGVAYWRSMGLTETQEDISATSWQGHVIAVWRDRSRNVLMSYVDNIPAVGAIAPPPGPPFWVEVVAGTQGMLAPHLFLSSGGMYMSTRDASSSRVRIYEGSMDSRQRGGVGVRLDVRDTRAYLLETSRYTPCVETAIEPGEVGVAETPWMWLAWVGTNGGHSVNIWRLSIDRPGATMEYAGHGF